MIVSGIYEIRNQVNGKRYIGSAVNVLRRRRQHFYSLCHAKHFNPHLQRAFDKYGKPSFVFEVLEYAECERLIDREQYYLDILKPEYNIASTAGSPLGCRRSSETRRKISEAQKGHRVSEATRRKISRGLKMDGKVLRLRLRKGLAHKLEKLATLSRRSEIDVIRLLLEDATAEQLDVRKSIQSKKPA